MSYQLDPDTEGTNWITHPAPGSASNVDTIEGDQRVVKAKTTVSLVPFGKVEGESYEFFDFFFNFSTSSELSQEMLLVILLRRL